MKTLNEGHIEQLNELSRVPVAMLRRTSASQNGPDLVLVGRVTPLEKTIFCAKFFSRSLAASGRRNHLSHGRCNARLID
jgi:hypothetical protein